MKVKFELDEGIVTGDTKRLIELYNTGIVFTQRKSYDEYYSETEQEVDTTLEVLSLISERLDVEVRGDVVVITENC
jgi:K+/H+ antiporter YhaU regulatory subunit KhtT